MPPSIDLAAERALQTLVVALASDGVLRSAADCSDGGLAVALAEGCFDTGGIGVEASFDQVAVAGSADITVAATLFGESASRVMVSIAPDDVAVVLERAAAAGVPARVVGQTGGNLLRIAVGGRVVVDVPVAEAERVWSSAIEAYFKKQAA
jgi:phosphoribosylformylglycinamidine synthase